MVSRNRGAKKAKLRDLSEQPLTDAEQDVLIDAFVAKTPPIVTAILGAVLVEHELETSLRKKLPRKDEETWLRMLDERGPYSTLSRKIVAGHALHIYDEDFQTNLDIIRVIRNAFAHSKRVIDFDHPLVIAQLKRIAIPSFKKRRFMELKMAKDGLSSYRSLCLLTATWLIKRRVNSNKASAAARRRRSKSASSSFYDMLLPSLKLSNLGKADGSDQELNQLSSLVDQTSGPTREAPRGLLDGLLTLGQGYRRHEQS